MLPVELRVLGFSAILGLVHIVAASHSASLQRGYKWTAGPRDESLAPLSGTAGRLARALANFSETFAIFAALVLAVVASGRSGALSEWGVLLYFWARLAYL